MRFQTFLGPSRFGPWAAAVAWPDDGTLTLPEAARQELAEGFGGRLRLGARATRADAAQEVSLLLAAMLLPGARGPRGRAARAEHAVVLASWHLEGARTLIEVAVSLVRAVAEGRAFEIPIGRLRFLSPDEDELPEQSLLRGTAQLLGHFAHRVDLLDGSALLVLGSGSRQRRILGLLPDATTFAGALATNKNVACDLLARAGIPVPEGETVSSRADAHRVARALGFPVTLKVAQGSRQRGVVPLVISEKALDRALDLFSKGHGKKSAVARELRLERHVAGNYYRAFVANGEFVACATTPLPLVRGDGKRTIRELIPRAHPWLEEVLAGRDAALAKNALGIVRHVLAGHDLGPESVVPRGREVPVAFPTSQGFAQDVTAEVCPENRALLVRAARVLGMFWSGIDVQARRMDVPLTRGEAAILEVNDIPAFAFHGTPLPGKGQGVDMGRAIFRAFWRDRRPEVPVVLVTGDPREAARLAPRIARGLERRGLRVPSPPPLAEGETPGTALALDPEVDAIVLAPGDDVLIERGLGVPGIDALVIAGKPVHPTPPDLAALLEFARRQGRGERIAHAPAAELVSRAVEVAWKRSRT